jgi:glutamine synthetase
MHTSGEHQAAASTHGVEAELATNCRDVKSVVLAFPDLHGNLRGKMLRPDLLESQQARTEGLATTNLLLAVDPVDEPITTFTDIGLNGGAKDLMLRPDLSTMRPLPWFPDASVVLGDLCESNGAPCDVSPRQVLRNALTALRAKGIRLKVAFEFEFRLFKAGGWEPAATGLSYSPAVLSQITDFVGTFSRFADDLHLGLAVIHSEGAPGLIEVNVEPQCGLAAADTAALLRLAAVEAARTHGLRAVFMAKPIAGEEGSSAHVHFSMWDDEDRNALRAVSEDRDDEFYRRAAWGMLAHLPALSLVYNPTINSYKRLVPGFFAPVSAACGPEDRSYAVRALLRGPIASRFELRRPGADCNPYLTLAAIAASICVGLADESAPTRDELDRYEAGLPTSLEGAVAEFRRRDRRLDQVLGADFMEHYLTTRTWELHAWQEAVTTWERDRYAPAQ